MFSRTSQRLIKSRNPDNNPIAFTLNVTSIPYFKEKAFPYLKRALRRTLCRSFGVLPKVYAKESMPYVRFGDNMTELMYMHGEHEPCLQRLIDFCIQEWNCNDFLIDIGANVGLVSLQNGSKFKNCYCFEPNPEVFNILQVNLSTTSINPAHCFNVGLGLEREVLDLIIPKRNHAGAFIKQNNRYEEKALTEKDGLDTINTNDYITKKVSIEDAVFFEKNVVNILRRRQTTCGLIKIDVEGYENNVLRTILPTLQDFQFVVFFESLDSLKADELYDLFESAGLTAIQPYIMDPRTRHGSALSKILHVLRHGRRCELLELKKGETSIPCQDIVVAVNLPHPKNQK